MSHERRYPDGDQPARRLDRLSPLQSQRQNRYRSSDSTRRMERLGRISKRSHEPQGTAGGIHACQPTLPCPFCSYRRGYWSRETNHRRSHSGLYSRLRWSDTPLLCENHVLALPPSHADVAFIASHFVAVAFVASGSLAVSSRHALSPPHIDAESRHALSSSYIDVASRIVLCTGAAQYQVSSRSEL